MWIYDDPVKDPYEQKINRTLFKILKNEDLANRGSRNLGLFQFLTKNKFSSSEELRKNILLKKGKSFFSKEDSKKVFDFFNQVGGSDQTAYDLMVERWFNFMFYLTPEFIQNPLKVATPFMFPLKTLESIPGYGEVLGMSVDVVTQFNKNAAKMSQQYTPLIMGFVPIPEASTVGIVVGYMISTMFIFFNMIIFVTRHDFGEAFTQSLALFPFVGMALQNFAESGDKLTEKFAKKRERIISELNSSGIFAPLGYIIKEYTFDPMYQGNPEEDAKKFKEGLQSRIVSAQNSGKDLLMKIQDPEKRRELLKQANEKVSGIHSQMTDKLSELRQYPQAQNLLSKIGELKDKATKLTENPEAQNLLSKATELKDNLQLKGGKRLSKIKTKKAKWQTQRRSKL
jgi:hypothetical protein